MHQGYLIVMKPRVSLRYYEESHSKQASTDFVKQLRSAFIRFPPEKYRGISRFPLEGDFWQSPAAIKDLEDHGVDMKSNKAARTRLYERIGRDEYFWDESLVPSLEDARSVCGLLDEPESWEIIQVRREEFHPGPTTAGFDVGYWNGDHFSLIADTIITPMWHGSAPEDWDELRGQLSQLNSDLLFGRPEDAAAFRAWYISKPWAETEDEPGEFCIIQVDMVPSSHSSTTEKASL